MVHALLKIASAHATSALVGMLPTTRGGAPTAPARRALDAALGAADMPITPAQRRGMVEAVAAVLDGRQRRLNARCRQWSTRASYASSRALPHGTPAARLDLQRTQRMARVLHCLRGGRHDPAIAIVTGEECKYTEMEAGEWSTRWYTSWRVRALQITPATWHYLYAAPEMRCPARMPTIDLQLAHNLARVDIYRAQWLVQGRGNSWRVASGYIARMASGEIAHGASVGECIRTLRARAEIAAAHRAAAGVAARVREYGLAHVLFTASGELLHRKITRADSHRAGNCRAGTDVFAARAGWARRKHITVIELASAAARQCSSYADRVIVEALTAP